MVEWNVRQPAEHNGGAGMWDSHIRFVYQTAWHSSANILSNPCRLGGGALPTYRWNRTSSYSLTSSWN